MSINTTWSLDTSSGTATNYHIDEYTIYHGEEMKPSRPKQSKFNSKPMEQIVNAGIMKGKISLFGNRTSPSFSDYDHLRRSGIAPYYADPVLSGYDAPPKLFIYDYSVIIDAFEYIPELMARANLIKEALSTLTNSDRFIIMMAMTTQMVNELAKKEKYEEVGDKFLITCNGGLKGLTIQGVEAEELILAAHFAGGQAAEIDKNIETDMVCVRAYPMQ